MLSPRDWLKRQFLSYLDRKGLRIERVHGAADAFFESLVEQHLQRSRDLCFIQIGANDGVSFDPLHPFVTRYPDRVRGIVVEPLRDKFAQLCRTYAAYPGIVKVNAAIHNTQRRMTLHRVDPAMEKRLPAWSKGIASFHAEHMQRNQIPAEHVLTEEVECLTLQELLDEHAVTRVDLLVTDTEGYDREILSALDFERMKPRLIHFEHGLPGGLMTPAQLRDLTGLLHRHGYAVHIQYFDAVAFLPDGPRP